MKKYLMTGIAALAMCAGFTSCSHDLEAPSQEEINEVNAQKVTETYNRAFIAKFGQPAADQDWGFSYSTSARTRANNPGESFNPTSTGINANANEWADPTPGKTFGGLVVPDKLTDDQKALVARYFQTVTPLTYTDPQWRNFFVQQVYKGGSTTVNNTTEGIVAANGTPYNSDAMNELSVGNSNIHINNFNHGTYGVESGEHKGETGVGVLDKGWTANDFDKHHHIDQIMLMVGIDDTECMGYKCSGSSQQVNNKAALVSWRTIAQWQVSLGEISSIEQSILNDTWNRSFVGFDLALKSQEDSYAKKDGNYKYAMLDEVPNRNNIDYVWDGTKVIKIGTKPAAKADQDITDMLQNATTEGSGSITKNSSTGYWEWNGGNFYVNNLNYDLTGFTKLVIEYESATTQNYNLEFSVDGYLTGWDQNRKSGVTKEEVDITNATKLKYIKFSNGKPAIIKKIYLSAGANDEYYESAYLLGNGQQLRYMHSDMNMYAGTSTTITDADLQITKDNKLCLNLAKINELVGDGYLPVDGSALKTWAKWADSDGYYSDWIVTLTEAKKISDTGNPEVEYETRIIGEDLTPGETDWDFNDVVFAVEFSGTTANCTLLAAGGTLPLRIYTVANETNPDQNYVEVHDLFGVATNVMVNTGGISTTVDKKPTFSVTGVDSSKRGKDIIIRVNKGTSDKPNWVELKAEKGDPAAKLAVSKNFKVCTERQNINTVYTRFSDWVADKGVIWY